MHIDEEIGVERHRGRRRSMRALVAASLAAALGACSGISTKNDPEAERIVKKVIEAQKKFLMAIKKKTRLKSYIDLFIIGCSN